MMVSVDSLHFCDVNISQNLQYIPLEENTMDVDIGERPKLYLGDSWFGSVMSIATICRTGDHVYMHDGEDCSFQISEEDS